MRVTSTSTLTVTNDILFLLTLNQMPANVYIQQLWKSKKYFLSVSNHHGIAICLITAIVFFLFIFQQYPIQSFRHSSLSLRTSNKIKNDSQPRRQLTKLLVISHFHEDLDWLSLYINEKIPHIIYTHSNDPLLLHSIPVNKGREAVAYLRYIIDYYSNLSSLIAFIHGHRTSWHQKDPSDIVVALRALQWNKYTYMPLTSIMTAAKFKLNTGEQQTTVNYELWRDVLQAELGSPPAKGIRTHCCATFVVKREAILAHPKHFYSRILDYIVASRYSDQITGRALEYTWHMIFGQPAHMSYNKCDIFVCDSKGMISVQLAEKNSSKLFLT